MRMPISPIVLQRRHAELGRIRLGNKTGTGKGRPQKLSQFRFTSPSEQYIRDLAELYGGQPQPWDNNGKPEFEVLSTAASIPVIVVKGGLSQWMETWSGGGIQHRCTGEHDVEGNPCNPNDRGHQEAKPTTRLSVMLPELEAVGVFRMETHGWNAAAEIPAVAELAQFVGDLVPAVLHLVERRAVKDGKTSRFVVPVLDLKIGTERLREIVAAKSGGTPEITNGHAERPAIESAPAPDYLAEAKAASTLDEVRDIWTRANTAGHLTPDLAAELKTIGDRLAATAETSGAGGGETQQQQAPAGSGSPAPGHDLDPDQVWQQILSAAGGKQPPMTTEQVAAECSTFLGGVDPATASGGELAAYLNHLKEQ